SVFQTHKLDHGKLSGDGTEQVTDEEVAGAALGVGGVWAADAVVGAGDDEHLEVLVGGPQGIGEAQRRLRGDVRIQFGDDQHQFASKLRGVVDVGAFGVLRSHGVSHPLFVP